MPRLHKSSASKGQKSFAAALGKDAGSNEKHPEGETRRTPLSPVKEKIGEGDDNLRGREDDFKRRRGTTR